MEYRFAPSILSADFTRLGDQLREIETAGADSIHIDIMDGHFVPNLTMGPFIVEHCRKATSLPLDVHLMIEHPENMVDDFIQAGADSLTIHTEASPNTHRTVQYIQAQGIKAGVAVNPGTPGLDLRPFLSLADLFLVMTVNPGYSGQAFIAEMNEKVRKLRGWLDEAGLQTDIQVDGGINAGTLPPVKEAGANVFVAGSAVFGHPDGVAAGIQAFKKGL
jgi:ribulose-phosphate 3-epimerase